MNETELDSLGGSLAFRIAKAIAEQARLMESDRLMVNVNRDGSLILRAVRRRYTLSELVGRIDPKNRHAEVIWGEPKGPQAF